MQINIHFILGSVNGGVWDNITRGVVHDYTSLSMQKQTSKHHLLSCGGAKRRHITN